MEKRWEWNQGNGKTLAWSGVKNTRYVCFNVKINKNMVGKNYIMNSLEAFRLQYFYRKE